MLPGFAQFFERRGAPTPPLPYDAEVEYLESTGTQWIDSGVALTNASLADLTWVVQVVTSNDGCTGAFSTTGLAAMYINFYANRFYMRNMRGSGGSFPGTSGFNTIRFSSGSTYLNGEVVESDIPLNTNPSLSLYIFAANSRDGEARNLCKIRLSSFVVKENGVLVRDFIPVRFTNELGQSEGAMYDRVSGALFRNAGTGAFTIGPDKS